MEDQIQFNIKLTKTEKILIKENAALFGFQTMSGYIKFVALNCDVKEVAAEHFTVSDDGIGRQYNLKLTKLQKIVIEEKSKPFPSMSAYVKFVALNSTIRVEAKRHKDKSE